jgi:hypothetical protein
LFVSGADIVLRGAFNDVSITCCTLDPGNTANPDTPALLAESPPTALSAPVFAVSADGRNLVPCRIWIEGSIATLTIGRSVLGPIRTRGDGEVDNLCLTDSIVQGIRTANWGPFGTGDIKDPTRLAKVLLAARDAVSHYLVGLPALAAWQKEMSASPPLDPPAVGSAVALSPLVTALNKLVAGPPLFNRLAFAGVPLSDGTRELRRQALFSPSFIPEFNRSLLEDAYPVELADTALALSDGNVSLSRCTVLGRLRVHRLEASECILNDLAVVDDTQHGCIRFTCWTTNSVVPRQYESVRTAPEAPLFTATEFGQPGYGQLLPTADTQIIGAGGTASATEPPSILTGAENGSEMGAFCLAQNSIKDAALLIKYQEYMPAGLVPVLIHVT